jgi:hypothetical protein
MPITAREKLLSLTNLTGCNNAWEHFCSVTVGATATNRVYGNYLVRYVGVLPKLITYVVSKKMNIAYLPKISVMNVKYIGVNKKNIVYAEPKTIKIIYKCKQ